MSDNDDDEIYAWVGGDNNDDSDDNKGELISGSFTGTKKRQSSSRRASKTPQYKDSSSDEDIAALSDSDHDDAVIVDQKKKSTSESKKKAALRAKIVMNAPLKKKSPKKEVEEVVTLDDDDDEEDDRKPTSVKSTDKVAAGSVKSDSNTAASKNATNEGINIVIPHSLLNKHQGTARNECIMLVQVESNDDTSHHLDFHGQSGAVGRFEADEEGGTFVLLLSCGVKLGGMHLELISVHILHPFPIHNYTTKTKKSFSISKAINTEEQFVQVPPQWW